MEIPPVRNRSKRQWQALAAIRLAKGEPGSSVAADMVAQGLDEPSARFIVEEAIRSGRSRAVVLMVVGLAMAGLGFIVTVASLLMVTSRSDQFWIWYGPMIVGTIVAIVGFVRLLKFQR